MKKKIFSFIYFKLFGWSTNFTIPIEKKAVICVAPHTSNWDLFVGKSLWTALGRKACFMMKKEWFFFPLGPIFRSMGGIPVDRSRKTSLVEQMTEIYNKSDEFLLAITPEGTRKANPKWKKGFYYIALNAKVPIMLLAPDYSRKVVDFSKTIIPSGDIDKDMAEIKQHFSQFKGKHPENFAI